MDADVKGRLGDNVRGLKGIGQKRAEKILAETSPQDWESKIKELYAEKGCDYDKNYFLLKLGVRE